MNASRPESIESLACCVGNATRRSANLEPYRCQFDTLRLLENYVKVGGEKDGKAGIGHEGTL